MLELQWADYWDWVNMGVRDGLILFWAAYLLAWPLRWLVYLTTDRWI